jgi:hypothetical protein
MFSNNLSGANYDQQQCPSIARFGRTVLFEKNAIHWKTVE